METTTPTVENLLNRVVVSHDWMGKRFEQIIRAMDARTQQAVLQMSRAITAVVIGAEIRPSHYTSSNSVIYLDPLRIALTDEEAAVIDESPDFRSDFGKDFQFVGTWRYVTNDNEYLYTGAFEGRTLQNTVHSLGRLLFHELAHANDFYSHSTISRISCEENSAYCNSTPYNNYLLWARAYILSLQYGIASETANDYHIHNRDMQSYAAVRYLGNSANPAQKQVRGGEIGGWLASDEANHDYAYTSKHEDIAMLVEGVLVKYLFDADMDVGYIDRTESGLLDSAPVTWGQRGRIGDPTVARRAKHVMGLILPGFIPDSFYTALEPPRSMQTACSWRDNLDLECTPPSSFGRGLIEEGAEAEIPHAIELDMLNPHW